MIGRSTPNFVGVELPAERREQRSPGPLLLLLAGGSSEGERRLFRVRVPAGHVQGQTLKVELPDSVKAFYEAE